MSGLEFDEEILEVAFPPSFHIGEKVLSLCAVRDDGTYPGARRGEFIFERGQVGYVSDISVFLQRYYVYQVDFLDASCRLGMREDELCSLDHIPAEIQSRLALRRTKTSDMPTMHL